MPEFHAEPYISLAGLTHKAALIAWGAFYFRRIRGTGDDGQLKLVDDHDLARLHPPRRQTVGASSEPYGEATVEVHNAATNDLVNVVRTSTTNHVLVTGLTPDTEYVYKITINGEEWAAGERRDQTHHRRSLMNVQNPPCGCRVTGTGTRADPLRIEFCPVHNNQRGTIAVTLVRMDQLKSAIQARDWSDTEFQFDRVLRSLIKQQ